MMVTSLSVSACHIYQFGFIGNFCMPFCLCFCQLSRVLGNKQGSWEKVRKSAKILSKAQNFLRRHETCKAFKKAQNFWAKRKVLREAWEAQRLWTKRKDVGQSARSAKFFEQSAKILSYTQEAQGFLTKCEKRKDFEQSTVVFGKAVFTSLQQNIVCILKCSHPCNLIQVNKNGKTALMSFVSPLSYLCENYFLY